MEYCSQIYSSAHKYCLWLLVSIQKKDVEFINNPMLTDGLHSLELGK